MNDLLKPWQRLPKVSCAYCPRQAIGRVVATRPGELPDVEFNGDEPARIDISLLGAERPDIFAALVCRNHYEKAMDEAVRLSESGAMGSEFRQHWHQWLWNVRGLGWVFDLWFENPLDETDHWTHRAKRPLCLVGRHNWVLCLDMDGGAKARFCGRGCGARSGDTALLA